MEQALLALIGTLVAALTGERVWSGVRSHRHSTDGKPDGDNPGTATKEDIKAIKTDIAAINKNLSSLSSAFERHLGYHEGVREG